MYKEMESANLPEPEYKQIDSMVYATLKNKNYGIITNITDNVTEVTDNVTELQKAILRLINSDSTITNTNIAKELNTARETITRNISKLKALGILKRTGSDRKGYWTILKK